MTAEAVASTQSKILGMLKDSQGKSCLSEILLQFEERDRPLAELKVMSMAKAGSLSMQKRGRDYLVMLLKEPKDEIANVQTVKKQPIAKSLLRAVVTIPFSLQSDFISSELDVLSTEEVFDKLLNNAKHYVKLSLPFPEEAIIVHFASRLRELSKRNVKTQVLTREVFAPPSETDYHYLTLIKSLMRMWDICGAYGNGQMFEIRDFHQSMTSNELRRLHYESTHAKIIVVDGRECYVGSAEFRINSLYNNFELGFLVGGNITKQIETLYDLVWRHAKPVSYEQLRKLSRQHNVAKRKY